MLCGASIAYTTVSCWCRFVVVVAVLYRAVLMVYVVFYGGGGASSVVEAAELVVHRDGGEVQLTVGKE